MPGGSAASETAVRQDYGDDHDHHDEHGDHSETAKLHRSTSAGRALTI
jgi:hypothetical protein